MNLDKNIQDGLTARVADIRFDEPMRAHTTMQVGGNVDAWLQPKDMEELQSVLVFASENAIPWMAVGRGSNLLVRDGGLRGLAISLSNLNKLQVSEIEKVAGEKYDAIVTAEAGAKLPRLLGFCAEHGLTGLEGLEGVPGTVGGAVRMNAGTPHGCIGDSIIDVTILDKGEKLITKTAAKLELSYRKCKIPRTAVVISTRLGLKKSTIEAVRENLRRLRAKRESAQPTTQPGVGSVFRNPPKGSAWKLVDEAGLRGVRIGKARVSEQHANWIINEGGAAARDVETLIRLMRDRVKEKCGVLLDPEVVIVGEEG